MSNILTIVFRLTISCLIAGLIMGTTFIFTNKAKKANEYAREQKVVYSLLGYSKDKPIPDSMELHEMYRYIVATGGKQSIGYLVPAGAHGGDGGYFFIRISLAGEFIDSTAVSLSEEEVRDEGARNEAIAAALGEGVEVRFADQTVVVTDHGRRTAYLLSGTFPGFKTHIAMMLALDPEYSIIGLEIMEHEEDPGLGAEIEQDYFKKQFTYKPFEEVKNLEVAKKPLPDEYYRALEGEMDPAAARDVMMQYKDHDIYALTGATISSDAVNSGVRSMTKKFAYRMDILDKVIAQESIEVPF